MLITEPRSRRRSSSVASMTSSSPTHARPSTVALRLFTRPMSACDVTLLPEPDSPTMARVLPRSTLNDTPSTARTIPSSVGKLTRRSSTRTNASVMTASPAGR